MPSKSITPAENLLFSTESVSRVVSTPSDRVGSYPNNDQTDDPLRRSKRAKTGLTHCSNSRGKNSIVCADKWRLVWFQVGLLPDDDGQCK